MKNRCGHENGRPKGLSDCLNKSSKYDGTFLNRKPTSIKTVILFKIGRRFFFISLLLKTKSNQKNTRNMHKNFGFIESITLSS